MQKAREKNKGWRIDYFLISDKLKNNLVDSSIITKQMGSDHAPVLLKIKLASNLQKY